ncbi:MAG: hypothetical protein DRP71_10225 [Verrucomicrobia bacterium]|nr:MAG: hypothetical protein DRP71_10225 [Verrucomicrobiota bacterium]
MRTKITLFLLLLVGTLILFIVYIEPEWDAEKRFQENRLQILGAEAAEIDYLRISTPTNAEGPELEKSNGSWELTRPVRWPANPFAVNRILSQLQFLERETSFPVDDIGNSGQTLADFGLEPPEIVLTYRTRGVTHDLKIGRVTDIGNRLYMLAPDEERIHVVNRSLLDSMSISFENLRSSAVFSTPVFEIHSWNLQVRSAGNLRIRLTRRDNSWIFETPIRARANRAAVETTLGQIVDLKVKSFVGEGGGDPSLLGLVNPDLRLTVEGGSSRQSVLIGNPVPGGSDDEFYAKKEDNPTVFTLEIPFLDTLRTAQVVLRERRLFSLEPDELQSILITREGGESVTLQKLENGIWQVVTRGADQALQTMPGDQAIIQRLVDSLLWVQALPDNGFVSDAPSAADLERFGLSIPLWEVEVRARPSDQPNEPVSGAPAPETITEKLLIGGFEGTGTDHLHAKMEGPGAPFVYLIRSDILRQLRSRSVSYRDRSLQQLPEGARITALRISKLGTEEVAFSAELLTDGASWETSLGSLPTDTRDAAQTLVELLRNLEARTFLGSEFTPYVVLAGEQRPWSYLLEATIVLAGGPGSQTTPFRLYLAEVTGGTTLIAGAPELGLVFEARQDFVDAFSALVFDRHDPGEAPLPEPAVEVPAGEADPDKPPPGDEEPAPTGVPARDAAPAPAEEATSPADSEAVPDIP